MAYAVEDDVRVRNGFFVEEQFILTSTLTSLAIEKRAHNVITLVKNGITASPLVGGGVDFTFLPPHTINLTVAGVDGDFFDGMFGTELTSLVVQQFLDQATAVVKSGLVKRFGETKVELWEDPNETPPIVRFLTADYAGCLAEWSMLRKSHKFDPDAMTSLRLVKKSIMDQLAAIDLGDVKIPGETGTEGLLVSRGGNQVFTDLPNIHGVDFQRQDRDLGTRGTRRNTGRLRNSPVAAAGLTDPSVDQTQEGGAP